MKKVVTLLLLSLILQAATAQNTRFTFSGTIEYERSINMYAIIKKQIDKDNETFMRQAYEEYQKANPQFKKQKSVLTFSKDKALFTPLADEVVQNNGFMWSGSPTTQQNNVVFTDLLTGLSTSQKKAFEETFLLKDTIRHINWKITDETRDIIGYNCRRANAVIMDSVYVVAFYTDEIPVSGGPESFTGLPGMILGLALPHDNITWFATKVTDITVPDNKLTPPVKGKAVTNKQLREKLNAAMKDWGNEGRSYLQALLL